MACNTLNITGYILFENNPLTPNSIIKIVENQFVSVIYDISSEASSPWVSLIFEGERVSRMLKSLIFKDFVPLYSICKLIMPAK